MLFCKNQEIESTPFDTKPILVYAIPVFISSILFILIITLDQILVKHYFSSDQAGMYAAAGNLGKIIWVGSSFLTGPLFPKIVSLKAKGKNTSRLLMNSLIYTAALAGIGSIIFFIEPTLITTLLFGAQYTAAIPIIGMFAIALGIFGLIQILMTYNLAMEKFNFIYIFVIGIIFEVAGIVFFHNTLVDVVKILLTTNVFIIIALLIYNRKDLLNTNPDPECKC